MNRWLLAMGVVATAAWPCSGVTCETMVVTVPRTGSVIPSNAPAVGVQQALFSESSVDGGTLATPMSGTLLLEGSGGGFTAPLLASDVGLFLAPPSLPVGSTWRLSMQGTPQGQCSADGGFTVGPAAPLPTSSALVVLVGTHFQPAETGTSSCAGPRSALQVAQLRITPTAEMTPWLPLARWELEVDGQNIATSAFGRLGPGPYEASAIGPWLWVPVSTFAVQCQPVDGGSPERLQPGAHSVRLLARIAGVSAPVPSNTLPVQIDCAPAGELDAGLGEPDDAGSAVSDFDAGSSDSDAGTPNRRSTTAGCTAVGGLQLLALALLLRRRR